MWSYISTYFDIILDKKHKFYAFGKKKSENYVLWAETRYFQNRRKVMFRKFAFVAEIIGVDQLF